MSFILTANWKMNLTRAASINLTKELVRNFGDLKKSELWLAPSFTSIGEVKSLAGDKLKVGAQNAHWAESGAFTGEISCSMLKECGTDFVIVGHSERRHVFGEPDEMILKRAEAVIKSGLILIFCVGETLAEREAGKTDAILWQLKSIIDISKTVKNKVILAYEPVWAIGTGKTAAAEEIKSAHKYIKSLWSGGNSPKILYGGSVSKENIKAISLIEDVAGALIGGASNTSESFSAIINEVEG